MNKKNKKEQEFCNVCNRGHILKPGVHSDDCSENFFREHLEMWQQGWFDRMSAYQNCQDKKPRLPEDEDYMKGWGCCSRAVVAQNKAKKK
jgi:hypothetical protein